MRFTNTDAAIYKERVVFSAGLLGDSLASGVGQFVAGPDNKVFKAVAIIQPLSVTVSNAANSTFWPERLFNWRPCPSRVTQHFKIHMFNLRRDAGMDFVLNFDRFKAVFGQSFHHQFIKLPFQLVLDKNISHSNDSHLILVANELSVFEPRHKVAPAYTKLYFA